MIRRMFTAVFGSRSPDSTNNLSMLLARAADQSQISGGGAHLLCVKCGYDLHGLPGDTRCPECGTPVLWTAMQLARMLTEDVDGDPADHPSRQPFNFVRETLGYPIDAFLFVLDALRIAVEQNQKQPRPSPPVRAAALCEVAQELAFKYFGSESEARAVFLDWNIRTSDDLGRIVWAMVRGGVMHAQPGDTPEQFNGLFDIEQWHSE
jgi:uncharacterized repeat protein (TIGR04138 family)